MSAAGSRAEVTAALKHAAETDKKELKRFGLMFRFDSTRGTRKNKKEAGPWRVAGWKLRAAFRKEAGPRCGGQAEVSSFISKVFLMRLGQRGGGGP